MRQSSTREPVTRLRLPGRSVFSLFLVLALGPTGLSSQTALVPVSPGGSVAEQFTTQPCPSFHWAESPDATGYELLVYRLDGTDATRMAAIQRPDGELGTPALRQILPARVSSWAPPMDRCLEPGGRYAWTIRPRQDRGTYPVTTERRYFRVRDRSPIESVLARIANRMLEEGELTSEEVALLAAWSPETSTPTPLSPSTRIKPGPGVGTEPSVEVRGPAVAEPALVPPPAAMTVEGSTSLYGLFSEGGSYGVGGRSPTQGVYGIASASSGVTRGVYGWSASNNGRGVYGFVNHASGGTFGVHGESSSTAGTGVYGESTATSGFTYGVQGESESDKGIGVYGIARATSGATHGVRGVALSTTGTGVAGYAGSGGGQNFGVSGTSASSFGVGVAGFNDTPNGFTHGVYGRSGSSSGIGVSGFAAHISGGGIGVNGAANSASGWDFYASGSGIDYGPFTGSHEARLWEGFGAVESGMVVRVTGETQVRRKQGSVDLSSTLPTIRLASRAEDSAVFGVVVSEIDLPEGHWYEVRDGDRFASVNALGEGRVWVTDSSGPIRAGDYLTTSDIPGYAARQRDGILRNFTLGKAIETVDWDEITDTVEHDGETHKRVLLAVVYVSG